MTPTFKERLKEILTDYFGAVTLPKGIEEPLLMDDGNGNNEFQDYYLSKILTLVKELVPEEMHLGFAHQAEGWNYCRQKFLKNLGESDAEEK